MELHVHHNVPMLLVGDRGTGKTFCAQDMLICRLSEQEYVRAFVTFNTQTTANQAQVCAYMVNVHIPDGHCIAHAHSIL
jgi:dynein heavy chain